MATYRTDLMDEILTSPEAQKIIGQVSPIYGDAFVGLWLFQAIGYQLDDMAKWSREFEAETVPQTATWSLDYWEKNYNIPHNPHMNIEQRRARIISKIRDRAPMNPAKLAKYVTSATGVECEIIENTGKNTFKLVRHEQTGPLGLVRIALNEAKPAHLIYKINSSFASEAHTGEAVRTLLRMGGRVNNWGMEMARFNGRHRFDGSIWFGQQVHRDNLLGLLVQGPKWQTRETIRLASQWPAKVSNTEKGAARMQLRHRVQSGGRAALRQVVKASARQAYGTTASLITNKGFAFDGSYSFDGAKRFNANAAVPL